MANPEHIAKLSFREWNTWKRNLGRIDLRGADLRDALLSDKDLNGVDLEDADLRIADLRGVNLCEANLEGAKLEGADLRGADLRRATLLGANLRAVYFHDTNLYGADLRRANLSGAALIENVDFHEVQLNETIFGNVNLKGVLGLDTCRHDGPSIVDHRTLAQSGPLPLSFLRGCGLSDEFINYLPALLNQAIQFFSCFISYSTKDQEFAHRLYADLQNNNVRCWFAPHDIRGGKKIHEQIDEAIRVYDRLLLILSEASMSSEWVKTEIANARQKELAHGKRVLFPISLVPFESIRTWRNFDADAGKDSAREIREYFIPDFSNWKNHDKYRDQFARLLKALKAEGTSQ
jgi:uncharacterized protein YjbI with pentapeptide repeats